MAPLELILPSDSGEKMGFQITLLLTVVIYVEYLQDSIPVFETSHRGLKHLLSFPLKGRKVK